MTRDAYIYIKKKKKKTYRTSTALYTFLVFTRGFVQTIKNVVST